MKEVFKGVGIAAASCVVLLCLAYVSHQVCKYVLEDEGLGFVLTGLFVMSSVVLPLVVASLPILRMLAQHIRNSRPARD